MAEALAVLTGSRPWLAAAGLALLLIAEGAAPFFHHGFEGRGGGRWTHALRNLGLGLLNAAVVAIVFASAWFLTAEWADRNGFGLLNLLRDGVGLPDWAHLIGAICLLDIWMYLWHRANHEIPFLWRFHRVHHADAEMDVTTASRFHVGELVLSSTLRIPVLALIGAYAWELVLYELLMFAVVQFHHANISISSGVDRALRVLIVTPDIHRVHHSRWQPETDSNYASLLSVWDRVFGSFRLRADPSEIELGLAEFDGAESRTFSALITMPLELVRRDEAIEEDGAADCDS